MNKIAFFLMILLIIACDKKQVKDYDNFISDGYNFTFSDSHDFIEYNFLTDSLKGKFMGRLFYEVKLDITKEERDKIANKFYQIKVDDNSILKSNYAVDIIGDTRYMTTPSNGDNIKIYHRKKNINKVFVNSVFKDNKFFSNQDELNIVEFRDMVLGILESKRHYRASMDSLTSKFEKNKMFIF